MAENTSDLFGPAQISQSFLAAQQKFLPSGNLFKQMSEAVRIVSAAQMEYGRALMQANSVLFEAFLQPSPVPESDSRPSVAAREPDSAS